MYYSYVLISRKDGKFYIGCTSDLKRRFEEHNAGLNKSTKFRRPFEIVFYEAFVSKKDAEVAEKFWKSGYGREVLKDKIRDSLKIITERCLSG